MVNNAQLEPKLGASLLMELRSNFLIFMRKIIFIDYLQKREPVSRVLPDITSSGYFLFLDLNKLIDGKDLPTMKM